MKFKSYKKLIASVALAAAAASLPVASFYMDHTSAAPSIVRAAEEPSEAQTEETTTQKIVFDGVIAETTEEGRSIYVGVDVPLSLEDKIFERLGMDEDELEAIDMEQVGITVTGEFVEDSEHPGEIITSTENLDGVIEVADGEATFSREGCFLATVSYGENETVSVIFHVGDERLAYMDINDWAVRIGTSSPNFMHASYVKFDDTQIRSIEADASKVDTDKAGSYLLTYTITDIDGETFDQDVIVIVGDRAEVKELTDEGVWEAVTGITVSPSTGNTAKDTTAPDLCFTPVKSSVSKGGSGSSKGNTGSPAANKGSADNKGNASNHGNTSNQGSSTEEGDEVHIHAYDNGVVTREATCTEPGEMTYTCTACGETKTEEIPALGHEYTSVVTKEPTCAEPGEKTYTCAVCDDTYTEEIPATEDHTYGEEVLVTEPTCTESGLKRSTCEVCGHMNEEEIPALGHAEDEGVITKEPTCTEAGEITYSCNRCGEVLRTEEIPAIGHTNDDGVVTKEPTCTEPGEVTHTCQVCGETYTEEMPATGHSYTSAVTKEATCTEAGIRTYTCENCWDTYTEEIPALGHTEDEGVITKEATCTEAGEITYRCTTCGEVIRTEVIPATGHSHGEGVVTKEPTCTEPGEMTYTCEDCGDTYTEEIPALGHSYASEVTQEATCDTDGIITYTCDNCGDTYTETIPATGHSYTSKVTQEATCDTDGIITYTCDNCGDTYTETIPATGHSYTSEVTKEATCEEAGVRTFTCEKCGDTYTEEIPATGHNYTSEVTQEATCDTDGIITHTCSSCGDTYTETIPACGHAWIHHDEVGHYETVVIEEAYTEEVPVWKVVCNGCGEEFDTADEAGLHVMEDFNDECQNYSSKIVGYETVEHPAVTEDVWVVDEEAYDECANCGERR